jgi:hypothetical protein
LNKGSQLAHDQHPADALGETLGRIDTLLSAVGAMFEPGREGFAVNDAFIMHSLIAAQGLLGSAQTSLVHLHDSCDLTLLSVAASDELVDEEEVFAEEASDLAETDPIPFTPRSSSGTQFVDQVTSSVANQEFSEILAERKTTPSEDERRAMQDGFAQNYLELLRKLTAAEIFAAEQQALSAPGTQHQLLPLLRSLREDFQKIHSAA